MKERHVGIRAVIVIGAVSVLAAALAAPAIGHGVHAAFAHNADKVDNKHAVGAGASKSARAGKLVATNGTGRLPNDIIAMAPNSKKLGGKTLAQTATRVAANRDDGDGQQAQNDLTSITLNTVDITAPSSGFLIISGMATVDAMFTDSGFSLIPQVDGVNVLATGEAAQALIASTTQETLSYTTIKQVGPGDHTVTQILSRFSQDDTGWNGEELIVQFVPTGSVTSS